MNVGSSQDQVSPDGASDGLIFDVIEVHWHWLSLEKEVTMNQSLIQMLDTILEVLELLMISFLYLVSMEYRLEI